ncbi:methyltransferase domain-containing protein [Candidatus Woesearchaeota archaeon]|nr:methyltransferase domain-containing protein [Candidatus Woesearchaeota archaeon]
MKKKLLKYLVCPLCKEKLSLTIFKKKSEIQDGLLTCANQHWYPVINGIPRILNDSLKEQILFSKNMDFFNKYKSRIPGISKTKENFLRDKSETAKIFGYEWKEFPELHKIYESQFKEWLYPIKKGFFRGKFILDAGCGTGRHIYYSRKYGAKEIIGIDLSEAVEVAYINNKKNNVHIIQADIYNLPFKKDIFDFIYSIGVLHHLPDPKKGFLSLLKFGKKGSTIAIWVYGQPTKLLKYIIDPLRKHVITKLPTPMIKTLAFFNTLIVFSLAKFIYMPLNKLTDKAKYLPLNFTFNYFSKFNFRIIFSMMYDIISPPHQVYLKKEDINDWFHRTELEKVKISRMKHSWGANGIIK